MITRQPQILLPAITVVFLRLGLPELETASRASQRVLSTAWLCF